MPIYEYECTKCGHRFEKIQKFGDRQVRTCPECKGKVERVLHAPAIQFKGSGFYINDYSSKGKPPKSESDSKKSKSESKSSSSKSSKD